MTTIQNLVEQIESEFNKKNNNQQIISKNISLVLDISGSTSQYFEPKKTILAKEIEVMTNYILANPDNNFVLYSFDSTAKSHGKINILKEENFVDLPDFKSGTSTNTCGALNMICDNLKNLKSDQVIIYTDGQTDNKQNEFTQIINKFKSSNIKLELVAISNLEKNLETITTNEESIIPGMDLVNMLGNFIDSLNIYNRFHNEIPFVGISNSSINKNCIKFMGIQINGFVIDFINKLLDNMEINKSKLIFEPNQMDLKKMLSEIGKLLSVLFVNFPNPHSFLDKIIFTTGTLLNDTIYKILVFINLWFSNIS